MKIIHILDHSLPLHSGYTFRSLNLLRAQQARGWETVVLTSPKHEENSPGDVPDVETLDGITYHRCGRVQAKLPFVGEWKLMSTLTGKLETLARKTRPDFIHAHSPALNGLPALRVGRKLGIPVVYEIRAFWEDAAVDHGTYAERSWKYLLTKAVETFVCRGVDHIGILCQGLKDDLVARGIPAAKITPVYNGINPDDFAPRPPDEEYQRDWNLAGKTIIGFIGSFYRYEGLDLLVQAFARVAKGRDDLVLLLVGGGEMEGELRALVRELGLEDKVRMPGRVPHSRVAGTYALVDVLVYPRYRMRLTELVTPLKPLEAMAMGRVLIASDVGGNKELVTDGQTGVLFPAGDLDGLEKALRRVLDDGQLRTHLQETGPVWVREHHTWERTTSVYSGIYAKAKAMRKK